MRRVLSVLLVLVTVSCADPAGANGRYCDVVKRIGVTADPLLGGAAYSDPTVLAAGMAVRVKAYTDLAATAPPSVRADTETVRGGLQQIAAAFAAKGNLSSAANEPPIATLVKDTKFLQAQANVTRFSTSVCKEKTLA
jgi:hypothetical protein